MQIRDEAMEPNFAADERGLNVKSINICKALRIMPDAYKMLSTYF